jgi:hypothetical protein
MGPKVIQQNAIKSVQCQTIRKYVVDTTRIPFTRPILVSMSIYINFFFSSDNWKEVEIIYQLFALISFCWMLCYLH